MQSLQKLLCSLETYPLVLDSNLTRGYLLEEDLGDVTFLQHISTFNNKKEEFQKMNYKFIIYKDIVQ